ncbi:dihydrofolate reductase [Patescibacteria group bacterium]|nr:dihydrofolate reductase [Patescibacteria group bacterium]MBU1931597.1 dihydrofolate reductase [Patescibacteria group bacterium]
MAKPTVSIICALSENRVIGDSGRIPWHIVPDLVRFKQKTLGHVVIMGRKAFDSMAEYYQERGRDLPKRTHIIVTRNPDYQVDLSGCMRAQSINAALELAGKIEPKEIFIAGGEEIFRQTIDRADKLYLTVIKGEFKGDAFFPDYSEFSQVVSEKKRESDGHKYTFLELTK